jgi:hypothetical protein
MTLTVGSLGAGNDTQNAKRLNSSSNLNFHAQLSPPVGGLSVPNGIMFQTAR